MGILYKKPIQSGFCARHCIEPILRSVEELNSVGFNLKEYTKNINFIGLNAEPIEVKIADLGFARELEQSDLASTMAGSPLTMAPEALAQKKYNHSVDIWSLGCIFYEMLTGYSVFTGTDKQNLYENIVRGQYKFPKTVKFSLKGLSFLKSCLQFDPKKRLSILDLANHEYLQIDEP